MKPNIVNIIHFIRWKDARHPERDLLEPLKGQMKLVKQYGFKATFLLQYDALIDPAFSGFVKQEADDSIEVGGWFEIVQQQVEAAGITWRGRPGFSWDWHSHVGFLVGYTPEERRRIIDVYMERFFGIFGYIPKSVGSWFMDTESVRYFSEKYGVQAICICRDQWGTDGYNLWGGYGPGYYPSRNNMFVPAQTEKEQIKVPVFRMLGSDPICQYDLGLKEEDGYCPPKAQGVCTMEPIYPKCGGNPQWVNWFYQENFNSLALPFGYVQAGQENAFGWAKMKDVLPMQWDILKQRLENREVELQLLSETGAWFLKQYSQTPVLTSVARTDWASQGRQSAWYYCPHYRVNFYFEKGRLWIRDLHYYDENYQERYLKNVCESHQCIYDALPAVDGYRWCGNSVRSGLYLNRADGCAIYGNQPDYRREDDKLIVTWSCELGTYTIICTPEGIEIRLDTAQDWKMELCWGADSIPVLNAENNMVSYEYNHFGYCLKADGKDVVYDAQRKTIRFFPESGRIALSPQA